MVPLTASENDPESMRECKKMPAIRPIMFSACDRCRMSLRLSATDNSTNASGNEVRAGHMVVLSLIYLCMLAQHQTRQLETGRHLLHSVAGTAALLHLPRFLSSASVVVPGHIFFFASFPFFLRRTEQHRHAPMSSSYTCLRAIRAAQEPRWPIL
jgi:hypothetical protein